MSNQPAFPTPSFWNGEQDGIVYGMTLRDYFAAKVLQGFCTASDVFIDEKTAVRAYEIADFMMKARNQE